MIRAEVKRRLVAMLGLALPDVHVAYTWAGDEATDATLWVGPATGTLEPESMERTGHLVVDEWTIRCSLERFGFDTAEDAEAAIEADLTAIDSMLRSAKRLRQVPGLNDDVSTKVRNVRLANVDGPFHSNPNLVGGDQVIGWSEFDLLCTADL